MIISIILSIVVICYLSWLSMYTLIRFQQKRPRYMWQSEHDRHTVLTLSCIFPFVPLFFVVVYQLCGGIGNNFLKVHNNAIDWIIKQWN